MPSFQRPEIPRVLSYGSVGLGVYYCSQLRLLFADRVSPALLLGFWCLGILCNWLNLAPYDWISRNQILNGIVMWRTQL